MFKSIIKKFKTVYCEDCKYSFIENRFYREESLSCKKFPINVDCTGKKDYIKRKEKNIIKSYKGCDNVRQKTSFCFYFSPKNKNI